MELLVGILSCLVVISFSILIFFLMIYTFILLWQKLKKKQIINNKWLKIRYILMAVPFVILGLYVLSLVFILERTVDIVVMFLFGVFLVLYPIFKCISKIKDIEYFGGIDD